MGINVEGAIIVFDEAHNLENACENSLSYELSFQDLSFTEEFFQKEGERNPSHSKYIYKILGLIKKLKNIEPYYTRVINNPRKVEPHNLFYGIKWV